MNWRKYLTVLFLDTYVCTSSEVILSKIFHIFQYTWEILCFLTSFIIEAKYFYETSNCLLSEDIN